MSSGDKTLLLFTLACGCSALRDTNNDLQYLATVILVFACLEVIGGWAIRVASIRQIRRNNARANKSA